MCGLGGGRTGQGCTKDESTLRRHRTAPHPPLHRRPTPAQAKVVLAAALVVFGHVGGGVLYAVTAVCCGLVLLIAQWEYPAVQSAGSAVPVNSTVDEEMKESRLRELRRYPPNAVLLAVYAGLAVMYVYQLVVTATLSGASFTPAPCPQAPPLSFCGAWAAKLWTWDGVRAYQT